MLDLLSFKYTYTMKTSEEAYSSGVFCNISPSMMERGIKKMCKVHISDTIKDRELKFERVC